MSLRKTIERRARRWHVCATCDGQIAPGETYFEHVHGPRWEGFAGWGRLRTHARCSVGDYR